MKQYKDLLQHVLKKGHKKDDRTGTGTLSVFGYQMRFDLNDGFPLLTTKKLHVKSIIHELLWFLSGDTNIKYLQDNGVKIWDSLADENGELGKVYGHQWRDFGGDNCVCHNDSYPYDCRCRYGVDQIKTVIEQLKQNPDSRRLLVSSWNPTEIDEMALPPCHVMFQFYTHEMTHGERIQWAKAHYGVVAPEGFEEYAQYGDRDAVSKTMDNMGVPKRKLSCQLYQRSADIFLGVPFNIASYALLTMMIAQVCGFACGEFIHTLGDAHLYLNHIEQAKLQLEREPLPLPKMVLNPNVKDIFAFKFYDFTLINYESHPHIKADVAV